MKRIVWLVLLAGCSKDTDYTSKALEPQTVTLEGVTYTVNIPKDLPNNKKTVGTWTSYKVEDDHVPKVFTMISSVSQPDIDAYAKWKIHNKDKMNLVRKETRPDGFAITDAPADKHRIEAITLKRIDADKAIECNAVQVGDGEVKNYEATKKMLEAICDSVTVAK